eukprot:GHVU01192960.1.p1 GENE.GHVU01192960.1~~GHVU01192960.1.p1  ORF type:complete len:166 (-),score=19.29 GHVU01192960.1:1118-1615(-)
MMMMKADSGWRPPKRSSTLYTGPIAIVPVPTLCPCASPPLMCRIGIYFGWAKTAARLRGREELRSAPTHGMVMSCGYAPYYDNAEMTIEPHIFAADLPEDFRGWDISLCIAGFIRAESNYPRFGHLVAAIQNDCEVALDALQGLERPTDAGDCSGWIEAPIQYAG